ncbi:hypothetical protein [Rhizomonospora bruguierae]|uniref:hypothetical protein n=1 Tax=Rhizomonospora bruguierae TaxID=1581705 RepID=UPI001BD0FA6C|nr:hypothetical protein [Micromonospora sp. NBRC 107566]
MTGPRAEGPSPTVAREHLRMHTEQPDRPWGCPSCTPQTRRTCPAWTWALTELARHGVRVPAPW